MTERKCSARLTAGIAGSAATLILGVGAAAADPAGGPDPNGPIRIELGTTTRDCDFNAFGAPRPSKGGGFAVIRATPATLIAEVHLTSAVPNATHTVRLIELPNSTCSPGTPGVAVETIETDAAGNGNVSFQTPLLPHVTGAWVTILDGSGQLYTSNAVAAVASGPGTTGQIEPVALPDTE